MTGLIPGEPSGRILEAKEVLNGVSILGAGQTTKGFRAPGIGMFGCMLIQLRVKVWSMER